MGSGNLTLVATSPVDEVLITCVLVGTPPTFRVSNGVRITGFPIVVNVGVPSSVVLTSTLSGALPLSTVAKNKSTEVKNTPFTSSSVSISDLT